MNDINNVFNICSSQDNTFLFKQLSECLQSNSKEVIAESITTGNNKKTTSEVSVDWIIHDKLSSVNLAGAGNFINPAQNPVTLYFQSCRKKIEFILKLKTRLLPGTLLKMLGAYLHVKMPEWPFFLIELSLCREFSIARK